MHAAKPNPSPVERSARTVYALRGWFICFLSAFALYAMTANRGAQWQDSGYHILRVVTQEPVNPLGLALSHPLHHWIGRFAVALNLVEPCFAVTLVSALAGAIAAANTFGCVFTLTRCLSASALAAASLAVAHTFWQMSTLAESYTLAAALLSAECWCWIGYGVTRRPHWLIAAAVGNGLGVSNHPLALLTTPVLVGVALFARRDGVVKGRQLWMGCAVWIVGALPYLVMIFAQWSRTGDLLTTLHSALFGGGYQSDVLNTTVSLRQFMIALGWIALNFPNLLLPAAVYGCVRAARRSVPVLVRRALLAGLSIHAVFVLRYPIVDQHTFFVPMYVLTTIFGGIGLAAVFQWSSRRARRVAVGGFVALLAVTPLLYAALPAVARRCAVLAGRERHKPYRDDYVYLFTPWSVVERSAERMSRGALSLTGKDGVILVEDRMAEFAVRYQVLRADAVDVTLASTMDPSGLETAATRGRTVVLVPRQTEQPTPAPKGYEWHGVGDLYVLERTQIRP